ncbi:MAG: hypothetical protein Q6368_011250 [Candidatus Baldrarchaeota archaeon]
MNSHDHIKTEGDKRIKISTPAFTVLFIATIVRAGYVAVLL